MYFHGAPTFLVLWRYDVLQTFSDRSATNSVGPAAVDVAFYSLVVLALPKDAHRAVI